MREPIGYSDTVRDLLERGREIPAVPKSVRLRVLERARAVVGTPGLREVVALAPEPSRRPSLVVWGLAAALMASVAGAVVAVRGREKDERPPLPSPSAPALSFPVTAPKPTFVAPSPAVTAPVVEEARRPQPRSVTQESYAAELELLRRAQSAYAQRDFATALAVIAEHTRKFSSGRLAEEREALRIRSLVSAGRTEEAARVTKAFAKRFPRSVLLPRLEQLSGVSGAP